MSEASTHADSPLRGRLEQAAEGLTYMSEADHPFEFFSVPGAGDRPPGADAFARLVGAAEGPAEERDLDKFFARHIDRSDPADVQAQAVRPRYEALRELLRTELRWTTVYRIGQVEVQCYVVGGDGWGNLAGLRTVAVET